MKPKIRKNVTAIILTATIALNSVNITVFAAKNPEPLTAKDSSVSGNDSTEYQYTDTIIERIDKSHFEYNADGYKVTFTIDSYWDGEYNASVMIQNTGCETIENWCLEFTFPQNIINIWNAEIVENNDNYYTIKNAGWNQDISAGQSVSFGMTVQGAIGIFPEAYEMICEPAQMASDRYEVFYTVTSDWTSGFNGNIEIKNNSDTPIEDWTVEFDFDNKIDSIWNGTIVSYEESHYIVKNADFNSIISPHSSVSFGFTVSSGDSLREILNIVLSDISTPRKIDILDIYEDGLLNEDGKYCLGNDYNGLYGSLSRADEVTEFTISVYDRNQQLIYFSDLVPSGQWHIEDMGLIYGYNRIVIKAAVGNRFDAKEVIIDSSTNKFFDRLTVDWSDDDGDNLPNYLEDYFKTDRTSADTDNDGLTDFQELYVFGYNPLEQDTDEDGITDFYEDEDEDNVVNGTELAIGSDPLDNDSDNDRLPDGEELAYGTSPVLVDTDGDGATDYEEYCLDSMNARYNAEDDTYTATFSADTMGTEYDEAVIPSIQLTADREGILSFNMDVVESDFLFNASMRGYIGAAYDFTTAGNMKNAELTFTYDESLLDPDMVNDKDFCPTIYYYDPDTDLLSEVEGQVWEGNKVTVNLSHFSRYILVNKADMEKLWAETLEVDDKASLTLANHVVFVIDKSGSMSSNDRNHMRTSLIREFCSRMGSNDKVGLIGFAGSSYKYTNGLVSDSGSIESAITAFDKAPDSGNTYMNDAVAKAVYMLENDVDESDDVQKVIFCLTDGVTSDKLSTVYLEDIKNRNIRIYTVGMGSVSDSYLKSVAGLTGGKYFYARTSSNLSEVFIDFENEINEYDSNRDNLGDEITKLICRGRLTTITGTRVFCAGKDEADWEKVYNAILENDDLDGDGLKNGEEIEIYTYRGRQYIRIKSSPELYDSDFDGYSDYEEVKIDFTYPLIENYKIDSADLLYVSNYRNFESGMAYEDYIDGNMIVNVTETYLDILLCGGELDLTRRMRKEFLDCMVTVTEENEDFLEGAGYINCINNVLRGCCDILPGIELGYDRYITTKEIAKIQKDIYTKWWGQPNGRKTRNALQKDIKAFKTKYAQHVDDIIENGGTSKLSKYGTYAGIALAFCAMTADNVDNALEYYAALDTLKTYNEIVYELQYCGSENVERAAQIIMQDLESVNTKYKTIAWESAENVFRHGALTGASYLITAKLGVSGLIIDLIWLVSSVTIGDALSIRLKNSMDVEVSMGIDLALDNTMKKAQYIPDARGKVNLIKYSSESPAYSKAFWTFDIAAKVWCEKKYLEYLNDDSIIFKDSTFIYKTDESKQNAINNISKLNEIYGNYNTLW